MSNLAEYGFSTTSIPQIFYLAVAQLACRHLPTLPCEARPCLGKGLVGSEGGRGKGVVELASVQSVMSTIVCARVCMCLEMVLYNHAQCDRHRLDLEELTRSHILDLDQQASHLQVRLQFIKGESHPVRQAAS